MDAQARSTLTIWRLCAGEPRNADTAGCGCAFLDGSFARGHGEANAEADDGLARIAGVRVCGCAWVAAVDGVAEGVDGLLVRWVGSQEWYRHRHFVRGGWDGRGAYDAGRVTDHRRALFRAQ